MDSYEHEQTAQNASFKIYDLTQSPAPVTNTYDSKSFPFNIASTSGLSGGTQNIPFWYGQLIALSGDYLSSFGDLNSETAATALSITTNRAYTIDDVFTFDWINDQPNAWDPGLGTLMGFLFLAANNPEHFRGPPVINSSSSTNSYAVDPTTDDSTLAYTGGHKSAISHALALTQSASTTSQDDQLEVYAIDAFYAHFLTDMFSSGHMRVPRRYLHNDDGVGDIFTSRQQHEEDGENGLWVTDLAGDAPWQAFGDGLQLSLSAPGQIEDDSSGNVKPNPPNSTNWTQCLSAVQASANEIGNALSTQANPSTYQALQYAPIPFPPGATVYAESKLGDYACSMQAGASAPTSITCLPMNFPNAQHALLIPDWLRTKTVTSNSKLGDLIDHPQGVMASIIGAVAAALIQTLKNYRVDQEISLTKPTYQLETKNSNQGQTPKGTQTYPIYLIADGKLYVRTNSLPTDSFYITAEYNSSDPTLYDGSSPPAMTQRLKVPQEGWSTALNNYGVSP